MSVIISPPNGNGFTSPVTIPVIFEDSLEFDDTVNYNGSLIILEPLTIPEDLNILGNSVFLDVYIEKDSTLQTPLIITDLAASVRDSVALGLFYDNFNADERLVSFYMGLSDVDCGKISLYRESASDYHFRFYPNKDVETFFYIKESGGFGFNYDSVNVLNASFDVDSIFELSSDVGDCFFNLIAENATVFSCESESETGFTAFKGYGTNFIANNLISFDIGISETVFFRLLYNKAGGGFYARIQVNFPTIFCFIGLTVNGITFQFGATVASSFRTDGLQILASSGGQGDSSVPSLASYATYSPTISQLKGTSATTVSNLFSNWFRVGNNVIINFQIRVEQGTVPSVEEQEYSISLPFTNTFSNSIEGAGCANMAGGVLGYGVCQSYALNSAFNVIIKVTSGSGATILNGSFCYEVF